MRVGLGDLVDRLCIVNQKIWHLENDVRHMKELNMPLEEIGRRALLIRDFNKERVSYKNAIDEISEEFFGDLKIDHASAYRANNFVSNPENKGTIDELTKLKNKELRSKLTRENLSLLKTKPVTSPKPSVKTKAKAKAKVKTVSTPNPGLIPDPMLTPNPVEK